jgi:hypothetical protein
VPLVHEVYEKQTPQHRPVPNNIPQNNPNP